ncbi:MAG: hypothetical protein EBY39_01835, partial [Flavobacteriia bacterium]|nr:hypothetical protein [Flavobacteriia bacterium]
YSDVVVAIGDFDFFASSASMNAQKGYEAVRAVGYKGAMGVVPSGPPGGDASFEFIGSALDPQFFAMLNPEVDGENITIGGSSGQNGLLTDMSVDVEPNQVVSSSASFQFFTPPTLNPNITPRGGNIEVADKAIVGGDLLHGAGDETGIGGPAFRASYSMSQSYDAIFEIGSMCPVFKYRTDGTEELTMEGDNLTATIKDCGVKCPETASLTLTIGGLCGNEWSRKVLGFVTSQGVTVSEGGVLTGTMTITDFS